MQDNKILTKEQIKENLKKSDIIIDEINAINVTRQVSRKVLR